MIVIAEDNVPVQIHETGADLVSIVITNKNRITHLVTAHPLIITTVTTAMKKATTVATAKSAVNQGTLLT